MPFNRFQTSWISSERASCHSLERGLDDERNDRLSSGVIFPKLFLVLTMLLQSPVRHGEGRNGQENMSLSIKQVIIISLSSETYLRCCWSSHWLPSTIRFQRSSSRKRQGWTRILWEWHELLCQQVEDSSKSSGRVNWRVQQTKGSNLSIDDSERIIRVLTAQNPTHDHKNVGFSRIVPRTAEADAQGPYTAYANISPNIQTSESIITRGFMILTSKNVVVERTRETFRTTSLSVQIRLTCGKGTWTALYHGRTGVYFHPSIRDG